jgi:hypothetical protein
MNGILSPVSTPKAAHTPSHAQGDRSFSERPFGALGGDDDMSDFGSKYEIREIYEPQIVEKRFGAVEVEASDELALESYLTEFGSVPTPKTLRYSPKGCDMLAVDDIMEELEAKPTPSQPVNSNPGPNIWIGALVVSTSAFDSNDITDGDIDYDLLRGDQIRRSAPTPKWQSTPKASDILDSCIDDILQDEDIPE